MSTENKPTPPPWQDPQPSRYEKMPPVLGSLPEKVDWPLYLIDLLTVLLPVYIAADTAKVGTKATILALVGAFLAHLRGFRRDARGRHRRTREGEPGAEDQSTDS